MKKNKELIVLIIIVIIISYFMFIYIQSTKPDALKNIRDYYISC